MATCAICSTTILFGGVTDGDLRFCSDKCHAAGLVHSVAEQVPDEVIEAHTLQLFHGLCPKCTDAMEREMTAYLQKNTPSPEA